MESSEMPDHKVDTCHSCDGCDDVQDRLLDAAERLFCEKGFDRVSIRELTAAANCNIAAVNYHFGGKKKLYTEMFRRQFSAMIQYNLQAIDRVMAQANPTLEQLIQAVIEGPVQRVSVNEAGGQIMRLLILEIMNKTIDPEYICKDMKTKFFDQLGDAILQLVPNLPKDKLLMVTLSFDGVVLHPFLLIDFYRKMLPELTPDQLIEHIVTFVAAAIRGYGDSIENGETK